MNSGATAANGLDKDIECVLVDREKIAARVRLLALQIAGQYNGQELTIVAVLAGSFIFLADLIRQLPLKMRLELVSICSYPGESITPRGLKTILPLRADLRGKNVLVIDDILDTGKTMQMLLQQVAGHKPASLRSCTLLVKDRPDLQGRPSPDYFGFIVPHQFVVGYGLDFDNLYRNLPDICVLRTESGEAASRRGGSS